MVGKDGFTSFSIYRDIQFFFTWSLDEQDYDVYSTYTSCLVMFSYMVTKMVKARAEP